MIPIDILSLGAGLQSSTLGLMASEGLIEPMPLCGIFSDTKVEPRSVYRWLDDWLEPRLAFPVYRVSAGNLAEHTLKLHDRKDGHGKWVSSGVPHYSINKDGTHGHGPRQCTHDFKIIPIQKKQRELVKDKMTAWRRVHRAALKEIAVHNKAVANWKRVKKSGLDPGPMPPRPQAAWDECQTDALVVCWIGISTDEATRMKPSRTPWIRNRWPLIEMGISRDKCESWMKSRGFPKAPKSACKFCPYHSDDEWIRIKDEEPIDFAEAVKFDYDYRAAKEATTRREGFQPFLHSSRKPLDQVVFKPDMRKRQLNLFEEECEGMCGV